MLLRGKLLLAYEHTCAGCRPGGSSFSVFDKGRVEELLQFDEDVDGSDWDEDELVLESNQQPTYRIEDFESGQTTAFKWMPEDLEEKRREAEGEESVELQWTGESTVKQEAVKGTANTRQRWTTVR